MKHNFLKCALCGRFMKIYTEEIYPCIEEASPMIMGEAIDPPEWCPVHQPCMNKRIERVKRWNLAQT